MAFGALAAASLQMVLVVVAFIASALGTCPSPGGPFACTALLRPRLGSLGPFGVSEVGVIGTALTLLIALNLRQYREVPRRLALAMAAIPAVGAGLVLGLQALPLMANAGLCGVCLVVVVSTLITAHLIALTAQQAGGIRLHGPAAAFLVALGVAGGLGGWRGSQIATQDAGAHERIEAASGSQGPLLILVSQRGCPFCEAMVLDVLSQPPVLELLGRTRGVQVVPPTDPLAREHSGGVTPYLLAISPQREVVGHVRGYSPPREVQRWLSGVLEAQEARAAKTAHKTQ